VATVARPPFQRRIHTSRTETVDVRLHGPAGFENAALTYGPVADNCHVELRLSDEAVITADEADYFEALVTVRRELDRRGLRLCCQGARKDVWASGMSRDMSGGLLGYVLRDGTTVAHPGDHVHIFAPAMPELVGTVEEQRRHAERWYGDARDDR